RRRPRRGLRAHDRPVHVRGHRVRTQAARRPRLRRLDPVQRHAGRPRVDGLVGGAQAAPRRRRADPGAGDRAADRGPGAGPACAAAAVVAGLRATGTEGPGGDRFLAPEIETTVDYVRSGDAVRAAETVTGP